jgi:4-hydroxy-2-oxoheptanedioate aldolase
MRTRHLKQKLARRELVVGTLMTLDFWPGYLEIYKSAGLDCVVLDMEHGSASPSVAEELCRIARLIDLPLILRPEASLYHLLRKYLDMGPAGFMIPRVEREEQVQILQEAAFCPPKGRRGPGGPAIYVECQ